MIIYKIINKVNGKIYVGQTKMPMARRWAQHKCGKRKSPLYASMKHHGIHNFEIVEICKAKSFEELNELEIQFIKQYDCVYPKGYNLSIGGYSNHGCKAWNKGIKSPKETTDKQSASHKGKEPWNKGVQMTEEARLKMSLAKKGQRCSPATEFQPGKPSVFKGRKHSEESLKLISKNGNRKEIQCIETGEIFNSIKEASEKLKISNSHLFRLCYNGKKDIKRGLTFKFI